MSDEFVYCPGCDLIIVPGQSVVGVHEEDPFRALWHKGCRDRFEYDERLGAMMSKISERKQGT